jgi:threonine dehydrogenase-like Zn-dependent dehydrogenase
MLAFVMQERGPRLEREYARPSSVAPSGSVPLVRVRTLVAGICNTDLEIARGYMGFRGVLGHEFVGRALDGALEGKRVVGGINFGCGVCEWCAGGLARHCPSRSVLGIVGADGVLAEEFAIPEENLLVVPDAIGDDAAAFAEPVGAACEILEQLGDIERQRALVLGGGKLGSIVAQVLAAEGFDVDLVGRHLDRLRWMSERGVRLVEGRPDRSGYPLVVEATGTTDGLAVAIDCTRPRGNLVLKTTVAGEHRVNLAPLVINEITVIGSRCGQFQPALDRLADGSVCVDPLIEQRYELGDVERAFDHAGRRGVRKILVQAA